MTLSLARQTGILPFRWILLFLACLPLAAAPTAAPSANRAIPPDDNLRAQLEWLRSDVNTAKIATLNQVLKLTEAEATAFWPVYQNYEKDLARVSDEKIALIREFLNLQESGKLTNAAADRLTVRWLANAEARIQLWKRYQKKVARAVSAVRAAQFLQVEHQMALFIDLNIASEMPAVRSPITAPK
ncbi:MAG: hypothetical protein U1G08_14815 [Verrucomicrobiota bacterium]